jgi:signal transduction histidine kinase
MSLNNISNIYSDAGDERQSMSYTLKGLALAQSTGNQRSVLIGLLNLGDSYEKLNQLDSAKVYTERAYQIAVQQKNVATIGIVLNNLGNIYSKLGQDSAALRHYRLSAPLSTEAERYDALCETYLGMARLFKKAGRSDTSFFYAKQALAKAQQAGFMNYVLAASDFLTTYYSARHQLDSAFVYQSATIAAKDSLFSQEKQSQLQNLSYDEALRQQQIQQAKAEAQTQTKFNMLFGGLGTLILVAFLLWRNNRQKQKAQTKIEKAYTELKTTQAQLIQSEKMASLGELMAGIAHEIQNPLNFINNFSEVTIEQLDDLTDAAAQGQGEEVAAISGEMRGNLQKVVSHGKRADAIVKGMLQHSRTGAGQKEPTRINALTNEYLKLSYHGLRAKDKSFNAKIETHFDESIGKVDIVPQEIGRVLLNLFNNAFYAVHEQLKKLGDGYDPIVSVSTKRINDKIEIGVKDNGMGISKSLQEKIFQPFFTTKPSGQGTGLGLSLSYDIIKALGGELTVHSIEGEGALFTIVLPQ